MTHRLTTGAKYLVLYLLLLMATAAVAQPKPAYMLFDSKGKKVSHDKMLRAIGKTDVLLFGELHNNPIAHWLQVEVTDAMRQQRPLVLGAEMLEADDQATLNRYLAGEIDAAAFDTLARLWPNYATDYAPLVNMAKKHSIPFIATNIPRRYARSVFQGGFEVLDLLPDAEKAWIAPLPVAYDPELPGYKAMLDMMGGHRGDNFPKAQAIKDATMGHFIMKNRQPSALFIHYNGSYHSDNYEGIQWYLRQRQPDVKCVTIATVLQKDVLKLEKEYLGRADFIICVDEDMTTTY